MDQTFDDDPEVHGIRQVLTHSAKVNGMIKLIIFDWDDVITL